jgi:hypothetical protein
MFIVDIDWPNSGHERYSYIGQTISGFTGNVQARLISISELSRTMREDKEFENSTVTVQLADSDGYFSTKLSNSDQYIKNALLSVYDDTTLLFTGYISSLPESSIGVFSITATLFTLIEKEINKKITVSEFPNVDAENAGQYSNYVFGLVSDEDIQDPVGELIAYRVSSRHYLAAWHELYSVTSVYSSISESLIPAANYDIEIDATTHYTYIVFSVPMADNELQVSFNAYGYGIFTPGNRYYIDNPLTCLDALNTLVGNPITFNGLSTAETEATTRGYKASFVINDGLSWKNFFVQFARNFDLNIWQTTDGKIALKMLNWGSEISSITINSTHITEFNNWKDITQICSRVRRMYYWHNRKQYYAKLPIDVTSLTGWVGDDVNLDLKWTIDNTTSLDVAGRYRTIHQDPLSWINVSVDKNIAKSIELGDVISVIYPKGYKPNKELLTQVFKKTYNDSFITLSLLYIGAVVDGILRLWDDSDPKVVLIHNESSGDCEVLL